MGADRLFRVCDRSAACTIRLFDRSPLPKGWGGKKRFVFVPINLILALLACVSDWLLYSQWYWLDSPIVDNNNNNNNNGTTGSPGSDDDDGHSKQLGLFGVVFLTFAVWISCLIPLQIFTHLFAIWRRAWRQWLVLVLETSALLGHCATPLTVALLLLLTAVCPTDGEFRNYRWQLGVFAGVHLLVLVWDMVKCVLLGACCCCCSSLTVAVWPVSSAFRKDPAKSRRSVCHKRRLAAEVLDWMPPEVDRGSWLHGVKWCILTSWTALASGAALASAIVLITVLILNRNFLYYRSCY